VNLEPDRVNAAEVTRWLLGQKLAGQQQLLGDRASSGVVGSPGVAGVDIWIEYRGPGILERPTVAPPEPELVRTAHVGYQVPGREVREALLTQRYEAPMTLTPSSPGRCPARRPRGGRAVA
jgi:hypothetical protein